jgi:hypothetical protein
MLRRVTFTRLHELKTLFGASWSERLDFAFENGDLYEIDFSMFESLGRAYYQESGETLVRYNPATLTPARLKLQVLPL